MKTSVLKVIKHKFLERHFEESVLFVVIGLISAVICCAYARIFNYAEYASHAFFHNFPVTSFILGPIGLMVSYALIVYVAPGATGAGIPQVIACIEIKDGTLLYRFLRKMVVIVKIISNVLAVFVGAATGREGPSLQIAAAISYNVGKFAQRWGLKVKTEQLLVAGAAGGLSAAFNTPIGGVIFAIEELSKEHVRNFRDVLILSVIIAGLASQAINGSYLFLGTPGVDADLTSWSVSLVVITAFLSGILGGAFTKYLIILMRWRARLKMWQQFTVVGCVGLILVTAIHYLGSRHGYSGKESINVVLFSKDTLPWYESLTRFFMPLLTSTTGVAGGVFAPALSAGAVIGGTLASFIDPELMVLLGLAGMVGFLTGITHTPITSFILVLEMTDRHAVVFPMMLAALCASIGAHIVSNHSYYEEVVEEIRAKTEKAKVDTIS
ncbi:MAG: chloride channel protein [Bacteriovoracaceae bacterium]